MVKDIALKFLSATSAPISMTLGSQGHRLRILMLKILC